MLRIAVDIPHFAIAQMHADAAAARAHVARRGFDFEFFVLCARVVFHLPSSCCCNCLQFAYRAMPSI
jgi:hypothetical protein